LTGSQKQIFGTHQQAKRSVRALSPRWQHQCCCGPGMPAPWWMCSGPPGPRGVSR